MNKKRVFITLIYILVLSFSFISCDNESSRLIGFWESESNVPIILFEDGTAIYGPALDVTWNIENNFIMFNIRDGEISIESEYKLSGNTLNLTDINGNIIIYKKISGNANSKFIGTWESEPEYEYPIINYELLKDGTGKHIIKTLRSNNVDNIKWMALGNHLTIILDGGFAIHYKYKLSGEKLILFNSEGTTGNFIKK